MEVIVLAGGLGTRLSEVVNDRPKCMADIAGKPFLWYLLKYLSRYNVRNVVLALGHLYEVVTDWIVENEKNFPLNIDFSIETEPLGTGGAIKKALKKTMGYDVIAINGDTFFDVDINELYDFHRLRPSKVTLALKPMEKFDRYGNVEIDNISKQIINFEEKKYCVSGLINGGIYVINKLGDVFGDYPDKFSFETDVLQPLCSHHLLYGMTNNGNFIDIGIPNDYVMAQEFLPQWIKRYEDKGC